MLYVQYFTYVANLHYVDNLTTGQYQDLEGGLCRYYPNPQTVFKRLDTYLNEISNVDGKYTNWNGLRGWMIVFGIALLAFLVMRILDFNPFIWFYNIDLATDNGTKYEDEELNFKSLYEQE